MEKDRREDVFAEIAEKFPMKEFKKFARCGIGLVLNFNDVESIIASYSESEDEQKVQILRLWAEKNGTRATNENLRQVVTNYFKLKKSYIPGERLEDVFQEVVEIFPNFGQFKKFAISKRGLLLDDNEVRLIAESNKSSEDKCLEMLQVWKLKTDFSEESNLSRTIQIQKLVDEYFSKEDEFAPRGAEGSTQAPTSQRRPQNDQSQDTNDDTRKQSGTRYETSNTYCD
uniref:uncharacterized protein LOC120332762 n=1 Tax=Styela clava TaxID=7725 RepID=UPI0019392938|nr:uncharacterized protein LOC120332762 [Styela clava]